MKHIAFLSFAVFSSSLLTSCSLMERWGIAQPSIKLVEKTRFVVGQRQYETRRYLISESPLETYSETLELRP